MASSFIFDLDLFFLSDVVTLPVHHLTSEYWCQGNLYLCF